MTATTTNDIGTCTGLPEPDPVAEAVDRRYRRRIQRSVIPTHARSTGDTHRIWLGAVADTEEILGRELTEAELEEASHLIDQTPPPAEDESPSGGCTEAPHDRHWIGCRYCEQNRRESLR